MDNTKLWLPNQLLHIFQKIDKKHINLNSLERLIIISLSNFYPKIYPSYSELENMTGVSRRRIISNIKNLITKEIITCEKRFDSAGDSTSNIYTINLEKLFTGVVTYRHYLVTYCHQGGDGASPQVVTERHPNYKDLTNKLTKRHGSTKKNLNNEVRSLVPWFGNNH